MAKMAQRRGAVGRGRVRGMASDTALCRFGQLSATGGVVKKPRSWELPGIRGNSWESRGRFWGSLSAGCHLFQPLVVRLFVGDSRSPGPLPKFIHSLVRRSGGGMTGGARPVSQATVSIDGARTRRSWGSTVRSLPFRSFRLHEIVPQCYGVVELCVLRREQQGDRSARSLRAEHSNDRFVCS